MLAGLQPDGHREAIPLRGQDLMGHLLRGPEQDQAARHRKDVLLHAGFLLPGPVDAEAAAILWLPLLIQVEDGGQDRPSAYVAMPQVAAPRLARVAHGHDVLPEVHLPQPPARLHREALRQGAVLPGPQAAHQAVEQPRVPAEARCTRIAVAAPSPVVAVERPFSRLARRVEEIALVLRTPAPAVAARLLCDSGQHLTRVIEPAHGPAQLRDVALWQEAVDDREFVHLQRTRYKPQCSRVQPPRVAIVTDVMCITDGPQWCKPPAVTSGKRLFTRQAKCSQVPQLEQQHLGVALAIHDAHSRG
mmetsp:Transcript_141914/g.344681  ORF Transcript_141914/g.344681 Transcript_141914/m.344681 type:complete len:303 (-) Transcript_141914:76-984(-)